MPATIDVLNDALGQIGAARISDIDDGAANANWCKIFYSQLRRALLRSHHWNFAIGRRELALEAQAPAFGYAYAFALPVDLLKVVEYNYTLVVQPPTAVDPNYWMRYSGYYTIEGRSLLTNDSRVFLVYVLDVVDPVIWDPLFTEVLTTWLASRLALAIAKDAKRSAELFSRAFSAFLPMAVAVDGQEHTILPYVSDELIWGR